MIIFDRIYSFNAKITLVITNQFQTKATVAIAQTISIKVHLALAL